MKNSIAIYVPSTIHNIPADPETVKMVRTTAKRNLAITHGGYTEYQTCGGWLGEHNELIEETTFRVVTFCSEIKISDLKNLIQLARWIKERMEQEAVTIEINNQLYFIW